MSTLSKLDYIEVNNEFLVLTKESPFKWDKKKKKKKRIRKPDIIVACLKIFSLTTGIIDRLGSQNAYSADKVGLISCLIFIAVLNEVLCYFPRFFSAVQIDGCWFRLRKTSSSVGRVVDCTRERALRANWAPNERISCSCCVHFAVTISVTMLRIGFSHNEYCCCAISLLLLNFYIQIYVHEA